MSARTRIWTDGSVHGVYGGWAYLIQSADREVERAGGVLSGPDARDGLTSNLMELYAILMGIEATDPDEPLRVLSDSRYVIDQINLGPRGMAGFLERRKTSSMRRWWLELIRLEHERDVEFKLIPRRSSTQARRVDNLAGKEIKVQRTSGPLGEPLSELGRRRFAPDLEHFLTPGRSTQKKGHACRSFDSIG